MSKPDPHAQSGAQQMASRFIQVLEMAGCTVEQPDLPRSYEGRGDAFAQEQIRTASLDVASQLVASCRKGARKPPDLWFSYHVYYKSPDWIGPIVSQEFGIPYVIAEGSHAPKRTHGPWAGGHEGAFNALQSADLLLAMSAFDRVCLEPIARRAVADFKPFIDAKPFLTFERRDRTDAQLLALGTMRNERKRDSFLHLAQAVERIRDRRINLTIAGDGPYRLAVEQAFANGRSQHDIQFVGAVAHQDVPRLMNDHDIFCWPGLGEAYGLVYLEAQASGLAIAACNNRGVPDVVVDGVTGLLSAPDDVEGYALSIQKLLDDLCFRQACAKQARAFVVRDRTIEIASHKLREYLRGMMP